MALKLFLSAWALLAVLAQPTHQQQQQQNNRPVLGVLLLENNEKTQQFIGASYVKYLESAGARVVPIFLRRSKDYYKQMVQNLNGILMPGGSNHIIHSEFATAADHLIEAAIEANDNQTYFPLWGTCLSFQKLIAYFTGNNKDWLSRCDIENVGLNLVVEEEGKGSRLFNWTDSSSIVKILENHPVTANYHMWCLNVTEFNSNANISQHFVKVTTNTFGEHHFVSTVEHKKYPFFGSAWHPEKNQFEWVVNARKGNISHDWYAIQAGQFFANFFVNEARKNCNHFKNKLEESQRLIYNYNGKYRLYTGKELNATFEEEYRFPLNFAENQASVIHQPQSALVLLCALLTVAFTSHNFQVV